MLQVIIRLVMKYVPQQNYVKLNLQVEFVKMKLFLVGRLFCRQGNGSRCGISSMEPDASSDIKSFFKMMELRRKLRMDLRYLNRIECCCGNMSIKWSGLYAIFVNENPTVFFTIET
ncbi:hypothetical protein RF11_03021 [Thelohanellus kitauei]|uniref:Uncharacterized protein n=1 Tax=Thelohanellus kitauei TaxID=669202 RepID=A0A0C2IRV6_THEKT|nr:hypothetical protein RF11_03021 [Thelohanellus kitauei]